MSASAKLYDEPADGHAPDLPGTVAALGAIQRATLDKAKFYKTEYEARLARDAEEREARPYLISGATLGGLACVVYGAVWLANTPTPPPGVLGFWASGLLLGASIEALRVAWRRN